jgi:predicted AAA+ superfamily ATPase
MSDASADRLRGPLLETYVAQNVAAILECHVPDARLYYWRLHRGPEIDLIIEAGRRLLAVEVAWKSAPRPADLEPLKTFRDGCGAKFVCGIFAYSGTEVVPLGEKLWAVPVPVILR